MCECSAKTAAIYSKKIIRRQQFFEEIAAGDCNTFVSVTPWETAVIGVSFSDTYVQRGQGQSAGKSQVFEDSMARSPDPGFGVNQSQNSSFEGSMARSPAPGFG